MGYLTLTRFTAFLSALLIALAIPAVATASGDDVIRDCAQDGDLDKEYSDEELQDAEENLPSDVDSYSNCRDVIRAAQTGGRGSKDGVGSGSGSGGTTSGGTGSGGSGGTGNESALDPNGSPKATPEDSNELDIREDAARNGTAPATDSELLGGTDAADDDSGLPTAVLAALILLALAGIGGGAYLMRDSLPPSLTSRLPGSSK
jgi:hypothetical protein